MVDEPGRGGVVGDFVTPSPRPRDPQVSGVGARSGYPSSTRRGRGRGGKDPPVMQIGEAASRVGLSLRTIRRWDEVGLVVPSERSLRRLPPLHRGRHRAPRAGEDVQAARLQPGADARPARHDGRARGRHRRGPRAHRRAAAQAVDVPGRGRRPGRGAALPGAGPRAALPGAAKAGHRRGALGARTAPRDQRRGIGRGQR